MSRAILFAVVLCASSAPVFAQTTPVVNAPGEALQILRQQQDDLKVRLDQGQVAGLTPRQVNAIRKDQKEFFAVTEGKPTLASLTMNEKIRLDNALERINAQVKGTREGDDAQDVCWRERVSGTGMKKTRCGTKAEMRDAREGARDFLEKPKVCVPPGCGA